MRYIKLFEDYYDSEGRKNYRDMPSEEELMYMADQAEHDAYDTFLQNVLSLNVDAIQSQIEHYDAGGAYYSDFIEGSMRKEGGYYTWYKDFGTPLHYLVSLETNNEEKESKKYEMIDLLGSCCIEKQDVNGNTPLHIVAMRDDLEMMGYILTSEYFTVDTKDLGITNNEGMTPLDLASPQMKKIVYTALGQDDDNNFDY